MNKIKKQLNKKTIFKIFSIILYAIIMLIYELLFCNGEFIKNLLGINNATSIIFNFSFARLFIYLLLGYVFIKFINKFSEKEIEEIKNKYKIIALIILYIVFVISISYFIYKQMGYYKIILLILNVLMGTIAITYLTNNYSKNILIIFMTVGILFCCTTQLNGSLDEKRHFMTAYNISIGNLNYKNNNISEESIEKVPRVCPMNESIKFFGIEYENKRFENNDAPIDEKPSVYNFIIYIPSAIGIFIGRILHGSVADIYILGRITNLITYMLLLIATMKQLPFKKNVFFVTYMMPIIILLAGSYSIDGICIGVIGLLIAYSLKLYKEPERISKSQIFKLATLFAISLLAKEMSYAFICLLFLILPLTKIIKQNKQAMAIAAIGVILVILVLAKGIFFGEDRALVSDTRSENTNVKQQIQFIISNPKADIEIAVNHIKGTLLNFHWLGYLNPSNFFGEFSNLFVIQFIFLLYVAISDNSFRFKMKEKIIIAITFLCVYGTGSLVLYLSFTPVGHNLILGYQTRYIFPILPLLFMIINNNNMEKEKKQQENISIIVTLFLIINLIGSIIFI